MRTWRVNDQDGDRDVTEAEILATYWPFWTELMRRAGRAEPITEARCIEDWVTVHWAYEVSPAADGQ